MARQTYVLGAAIQVRVVAMGGVSAGQVLKSLLVCSSVLGAAVAVLVWPTGPGVPLPRLTGTAILPDPDWNPLGTTLTLTVKGENEAGGAPGEGFLSISFPCVPESIANLRSDLPGNLPYVKGPGEMIGLHYGAGTVSARYPLVELRVDSWTASDEHEVSAEVTPALPGSFLFGEKVTMQGDAGWEKDPPRVNSAGALDQQGEFVVPRWLGVGTIAPPIAAAPHAMPELADRGVWMDENYYVVLPFENQAGEACIGASESESSENVAPHVLVGDLSKFGNQQADAAAFGPGPGELSFVQNHHWDWLAKSGVVEGATGAYTSMSDLMNLIHGVPLLFSDAALVAGILAAWPGSPLVDLSARYRYDFSMHPGAAMASGYVTVEVSPTEVQRLVDKIHSEMVLAALEQIAVETLVKLRQIPPWAYLLLAGVGLGILTVATLGAASPLAFVVFLAASDYREVVAPTYDPVPELASVPPGALRSFAENQTRWLADAEAYYESMHRYRLAAENLDTAYALLQLGAASGFAGDATRDLLAIRDLMPSVVDEIRAWDEALRGVGVNVDAINNDVAATKARLRTVGLESATLNFTFRRGLAAYVPEIVDSLINLDDTYFENPLSTLIATSDLALSHVGSDPVLGPGFPRTSWTPHIVGADDRNTVEGEPVSFDASATTVTNGTVTGFEWDFTGDGVPDRSGPTASFTWWDNVDVPATLFVRARVVVPLGNATYTFNVTVSRPFHVVVDNVPPVPNLESLWTDVAIVLRAAGEKWHFLRFAWENSMDALTWAPVVERVLERVPGPPSDQAIRIPSLWIDMERYQRIVVNWTPPGGDPVNGQPNGDTPTWLNITFADGRTAELFHNFNYQQSWLRNSSDPLFVNPWKTDPSRLLSLHPVFANGSATDQGTDDLTFAWSFGDGATASTTFYYNSVSPDPYPSPYDYDASRYPPAFRDQVSHVYGVEGDYIVQLEARDDDGGSASVSQALLGIHTLAYAWKG